jgi:HK97 family phage major capsid protein
MVATAKPWGATLPKRKSVVAQTNPPASVNFKAAVDAAVTAALDKMPDYKGRKGIFGGQAPRQIFQRGERPYSFSRAIALVKRAIDPSQAREEVQISNKLKQMYAYAGFDMNPDSLLVPISTALMFRNSSANESLVNEIYQKTAVQPYDRDELIYLQRKALGTLSDAAGGAFVDAPQIGQLLDMQRNLEAWTTAGATELPLPPNGRMFVSKMSSGSTGYWVGEGATITDSTPGTGSLELIAKKACALIKINNELIRFATPGTDALIRTEMAKRLALLVDSANFTGTGGTQPKGLLRYGSQTDWASDHNKWVTHTASTVDTNGNTFEPEDIFKMFGKLPDELQPGNVKAMLTRELFTATVARRADAVSANDAAGQFVQQMIFGGKNNIEFVLGGFPAVTSSQVPQDRTKGSGSDLTCVILGDFSHWAIARHGVMELELFRGGDTAITNDQTWIRAIQHVDCGPLHTPSFCVCDQLING